MPGVREHRAASVKLLALMVVLSGIPLVVLGWLAWRLVEQDRTLEAQRLRERLDNAAVLIAHELDHRLTDWDNLLTKYGEAQVMEPPPDTAFLLTNVQGVIQHRGLPISFYPLI